jgi:hypothetical protein
MPVCYESWTGNYVANISSLVPVVSSFSPAFIGICCLEPCHIYMNLLSCLGQAHQETFILINTDTSCRNCI